MSVVKQMAHTMRLRDHMASDDGWGNKPGVLVHQKLVRVVEEMPQVVMFRVSLEGVRCVDVSFARESVVRLAERYRGRKGFCLVHLDAADGIEIEDILDNWRLAAIDLQQPMTVWAVSLTFGPKTSGWRPAAAGLAAIGAICVRLARRSAPTAKPQALFRLSGSWTL